MIAASLSRSLAAVFILCFASAGLAREEIWTEVRSPNFVIVSNASVKEARRTAKRLEQYRLLIRAVMVDSKVDPPVPLTVFAAKDERTFKALLAEERTERGAAKRTGWFMPGQERSMAALRIDAPEDETYHVIYHEYVHLITNLTYGNLPLWLSEGMAEFFAYSELSSDLAYLGKVKPGVIQTLRSKPLVPLTTLFSVKHDSPYYRQQDKTSLFYTNSWALVHYLILGDRRTHEKSLMDFIAMIRSGVPETEAARTFGDLKALEAALDRYIRLPTTAFLEVPAKLEVKDDQYEARELSPAESLALRGELLVFYNKPDRAKTMLEQALKTDPKYARTHEAMGHLYMRLNDRQQAGIHFMAAADSDSRSYTANLYAAQAIRSQNGDPDAAEKYLRKAIALNPGFAPAHSQLSLLLLQKQNFDEALVHAKKVEALEPGIFAHKLNLMNIMTAMDRLDEAYQYARLVAAAARDDNEREMAKSSILRLQNALDRRAQNKRMQEEFEERMKRRASLEADLAVRNSQSRHELRNSADDDLEPKRWEEIAKLSSAARGPSVRIEGIIKSIKCESPAVMQVELDAHGVSKMLYSDNYSGIVIKSAAGKKGFQPCRDLEGKRVEIEYQIVSGQYFSGSVKSILIQ